MVKSNGTGDTITNTNNPPTTVNSTNAQSTYFFKVFEEEKSKTYALKLNTTDTFDIFEVESTSGAFKTLIEAYGTKLQAF